MGAKKRPMPTPEMMKGTIMAVYAIDVLAMSPSQARPIAIRLRPTPMSRPPPTRSESAPATGATKIGASVQGRIESPASRGE